MWEYSNLSLCRLQVWAKITLEQILEQTLEQTPYEIFNVITKQRSLSL